MAGGSPGPGRPGRLPRRGGSAQAGRAREDGGDGDGWAPARRRLRLGPECRCSGPRLGARRLQPPPAPAVPESPRLRGPRPRRPSLPFTAACAARPAEARPGPSAAARPPRPPPPPRRPPPWRVPCGAAASRVPARSGPARVAPAWSPRRSARRGPGRPREARVRGAGGGQRRRASAGPGRRGRAREPRRSGSPRVGVCGGEERATADRPAALPGRAGGTSVPATQGPPAPLTESKR
ncbi:proline-rich proteoglycan 2-like [Marmota monax]|uniref:proline-rich proteoglycan 2-like n=1 Tax=Marmota monax TaxID=9995 RepID=UPI001EAFF191|nr:proline-rich proteoglycan 2-like [Marmota monax]